MTLIEAMRNARATHMAFRRRGRESYFVLIGDLVWLFFQSTVHRHYQWSADDALATDYEMTAP